MTRDEFLSEFPALVKMYEPAPDVVAKISGVELLMLIGPSGAGKTTIIDNLDVPFIIGCTSRDPRPGEVEGRDFYFLKNYQQIFDDIESGRFVQTAVGPSGDFYATLASSYPFSGPATMPVVADVVPNFRKLGFKRTISAFVVAPSYEEWMRRMNAHHLTDQELRGRLAEAKRSLSFALHDRETHFILNDELEQAAKQTKDLLDDRIDENREAAAKKIAEELLEKI